MKLIKVESLSHLKRILANGPAEFFIALNFDCKSSKSMTYDKAKDLFHVSNWIDGTRQELISKELMSSKFTNIGRAIKRGTFYYESDAR